MSPPVLLVPEKINPALIEAIRGEGLGRLEIDERLCRDPDALLDRVAEADVSRGGQYYALWFRRRG